MFEQVILIIHAIAAIAIIGLILIQQGKGADAGASFGSGSSQTVFGVQGSGNLLTRWTSIIATVFFATSLTLAYVAKQKATSVGEIDGLLDEPAILEQVQVEDDGEIPVSDEETAVSAEAEEVPVADVPAESAASDVSASDVPAAEATAPADEDIPQ